ncbi:hypothetical protein F4809DRAFT_618766 [Biscogniauxia mediterranea]|nr:hypothetical protein F4809DRAFT_618766 [Biscogniauxia mediterranea]
MQSLCMHRRAVKVAWCWSRTLRGGDNFSAPRAVGINCRRHVSSSRSQAPRPSPSSSTGERAVRGGVARGPNVPAHKPLPFKSTSAKESQAASRREGAGANAKQPVAELVRNRWFALFGVGAATVCIGFFTASFVVHWLSDEPAPCYPLGCEPEAPTGRPSIQSPYEFDLHLDKSEYRYSITKLRRHIAAQARGHVLEIAVGTGRNLEFYNWDKVTEGLVSPEERNQESASWWQGKSQSNKTPGPKEESENAILSFTGLDISPSMLNITLQRIRQVVPHMVNSIPKKPYFAQLASTTTASNTITTTDVNKATPTIPVVSLVSNRIRIFSCDAQSHSLPSPPTFSSSPSSPSSSPLQYYDTIVQTFGLCSVRDPVALIVNLARAVRPGDGGRILLLEHGRSNWWELVNGMLDRSARGHFTRFGCWWNRDIEAIVREAERRVPGIEVRRLERPGWITLGTHVLVELGVRQVVEGGEKMDGGGKGGEVGKEAGEKGWLSFFSSSSSSSPSSSSSGVLLSVKKRDDEPKKNQR